ncbi:MAG: cell division protein ZapA [Rikenellaceae bacterium]|jgi:hypothetical protein|nr:cell division protein ZapA [Rikenellaceae bacterium]
MVKLTVKLKIADMEFPFLDVDSSEEELYRHAAKMVNQLHTALPKTTGWVAKQELALVALQLAMENLRMKTARSLGDDVDRLSEVERQLDDYFASEDR